jgi:hypothetical protein
MELHMHSHRYVRRLPDWLAACVSGFVAGAILMVLELLWTTLVTGDGPWGTTHAIAALMLGPQTVQTTGFSIDVVAAALVTHYLLGIAFGVILAGIIAPYHFDSSIGMAMLIGATYGLALYFLNFYGMARIYTWFADMRDWSTLVAHLIFGITAAGLYLKFESYKKETNDAS